ncbi:universal stress protein [Halovivax gelatinilyticus]|uniref:universal stress protein n=1 Tax=Halovivax gelatinilyticus TaxID=2961597 RepID=UPI0020CA4711|nr:universal stress protein [Halovivax gelatinilyticus]
MGTHVLVALDDSRPAWDALEHAIEYPNVDRLTIAHCLDPSEVLYWSGQGGYADVDGYERAHADGESLVSDARGHVEAASPDLTVETMVELGRPARTIVDIVGEVDADHVVIGSHGRSGVSRVLLGSVAEAVVRRAPCPVTVVR